MRHLTTTSGHSAPRRGSRGALPARQGGVTLIELITVMTIVVILMAIGVPSYRYVTTSNRMATEANALLADLQYARSEAIREGQPVTVCVSSDGASCDTSAVNPAWQKGWITYSNPGNVQTVDTTDPLLRVQKGFSGTGDTFQASNGVFEVTFSRDGFAQLGGSSTRVTLHDATSTSSYTRCLDVSQTGMMRVQTHSSDNTCT